jgi:hypothetical protein
MKITSRTNLARIAAFLASLLPAGAATAQDLARVRPSDEVWVPVKHLEFSPDDIEGGCLGPEGEAIISVQRARHASLIEIRAGFEGEIVKTMEDM